MTPLYALDSRSECIRALTRLGADPAAFADASDRELQDFVVALEMLATNYPDRVVRLMKGAKTKRRFWAKVNRKATNGCWVWTAYRNEDGYGIFSANHNKILGAHRFIYEALVGPIPMGYEIDHLCRNRACVNPAHLEMVTHRQNVLRGGGISAKAAQKTHCPQGHPYEGDNLDKWKLKKGARQCKICKNESARIAYRKKYPDRVVSMLGGGADE